MRVEDITDEYTLRCTPLEYSVLDKISCLTIVTKGPSPSNGAAEHIIPRFLHRISVCIPPWTSYSDFISVPWNEINNLIADSCYFKLLEVLCSFDISEEEVSSRSEYLTGCIYKTAVHLKQVFNFPNSQEIYPELFPGDVEMI